MVQHCNINFPLFFVGCLGNCGTIKRTSPQIISQTPKTSKVDDSKIRLCNTPKATYLYVFCWVLSMIQQIQLQVTCRRDVLAVQKLRIYSFIS